jgi:hypothetical protein
MAFPTPKVIPKASALFVPYELALYKHWRQSALGISVESDDDILLPSAFEYMDYHEWRAKQRAIMTGASEAEDASPALGFAGFVLAERCGHPLHPGNPRPGAQREQEGEAEEEGGEDQGKIAWCAMCVVQIHLKLLPELWDKWLESGGPWRIWRPGSTGENFQIGKRAYYMRKTDLVNDVDNLENIARLEAAWEAAHPAADVEVARAFSAKTAVEMYAKGIQFPARLADADKVVPRTPVPKERKKRLSYSPDTPEDTRHRSTSFFARHCTAYDPNSVYRCPGDDGWAETSFKNSWEYNVRQCRTLLCNKEPSLPNVTYHELTDDSSKDNLIKGIEEWFSKMPEDWKGPWAAILLTTTDIFLVWRGPPYTEGCGDDFNNWDRVETLVGSNLEAHARQIGDVTDDADVEPVTGDTTEDFFDQQSVASASDSDEEENELSDPMDLEKDEDMAIGTTAKGRQSGHTALG